jgi:hypothetical protein
MLFTNLMPVRTVRFAGRFAAFTLAAFIAAAVGSVGTVASAQTPAPGTAPMQPQPASSSADTQTPGQAAPGTAPIATHRAAVALAPGRGPSYNNKWDLYGGLSFMNGQAGQDVPKRYNMGGGEGMGTYWLTSHLGLAADYRFEAGTTPTPPNPGNNDIVHLNRVLVMQHILSGGVQYRGPRNRYVAINYHAFAGGTYGIFDHATQNYPGGSPVSACAAQQQPGQIGNLGLYCNHLAPWGAAGGSIDFNQGPRFAIRFSPDIIFEHFGTETHEYFSTSLGVLYRFGQR